MSRDIQSITVALSYLTDYAEERRSVGDLTFSLRYNFPVLIIQGFAGTLKDRQSGSPSTLVSSADFEATRQASVLIGRVFPLRKGTDASVSTISLGRTDDNDVAIPEYSISKRHCLFSLGGGEVTITDRGSTNGTLLNGLPIAPKVAMPIAPGAIITMGRFAFVFQSPVGFLKAARELG